MAQYSGPQHSTPVTRNVSQPSFLFPGRSTVASMPATGQQQFALGNTSRSSEIVSQVRQSVYKVKGGIFPTKNTYVTCVNGGNMEVTVVNKLGGTVESASLMPKQSLLGKVKRLLPGKETIVPVATPFIVTPSDTFAVSTLEIPINMIGKGGRVNIVMQTGEHAKASCKVKSSKVSSNAQVMVPAGSTYYPTGSVAAYPTSAGGIYPATTSGLVAPSFVPQTSIATGSNYPLAPTSMGQTTTGMQGNTLPSTSAPSSYPGGESMRPAIDPASVIISNADDVRKV